MGTPPVIFYLALDYSDDGADRRYLAAGESNGDGQDTYTLPETRRIHFEHKPD